MTTILTPRVRLHETQRLANAGYYNDHLTESIKADCAARKWESAGWRAHSIRDKGLRARALAYIEAERESTQQQATQEDGDEHTRR